MTLAAFGEPTGQGWTQVGELAIAFALCALIGLEREAKQKAAGVRTYTLVGTAAALFVLVSKYGFTDVLSNHVVLDPSRVAAQIVSGVGFIGGGIIFVHRDSVRGLTTAASVWLTAAIGAAAGAGLAVLAAVSTAAYFVAILGLPPLGHAVTRWTGARPVLHVTYHDGRGILRQILAAVTASGFLVVGLETPEPTTTSSPSEAGHSREVVVAIELAGRADLPNLLGQLGEIDGVLSIAQDAGEESF